MRDILLRNTVLARSSILLTSGIVKRLRVADEIGTPDLGKPFDVAQLMPEPRQAPTKRTSFVPPPPFEA